MPVSNLLPFHLKPHRKRTNTVLKRMTKYTVAILCLIAFTAERTEAQAFIEQIHPGVVKRGATTRIHLVGTELLTPVDIWTSLPTDLVDQVGMEADDQGNIFIDLEVSENAPLGLYGMRLATDDGLSNVHLFSIDDLETVLEEEYVSPKEHNNGKLELAQPIAYPATVAGAIKPTDVDYYSIEVTKGETLSFEVVGNRLGKALDPVVTILDEKGKFVVSRDNDVGLLFDLRFEHTFEKAGKYFLRLHDSRYVGSQHWSYSFRIGKFPIARVAIPSAVQPGASTKLGFPQVADSQAELALPADCDRSTVFFDFKREGDDASTWLPISVNNNKNQLELEPNDKQESAVVVTLETNIHGSFKDDQDWDWYSLELQKGITVDLKVETRNIGSPADVELTIYDPKGDVVKRVDDVGFEDAITSFTSPEEGTYYFKLREVVQHGGEAFAYRLEINALKTAIKATSGIGRIAVPIGTWQPLPIDIDRSRVAGDLTVQLLGVPEGFRLESNIIPADVTKWVGRLYIDDGVNTGVYAMHVNVQQIIEGEVKAESYANTQPLVDRIPTGRGPHGEPFELREDQRRLPASLKDQIAVLVTPPIPFDFKVNTPDVLLARYQHVEFKFDVMFDEGFQQPVTFEARGGELEQDRLRAPRVIAAIPEVTQSVSDLTGTLTSGVGTNLLSHRVTLTGSTTIGDRVINLTRTFELKIDAAFKPSGMQDPVDITIGKETMLEVFANRIDPFIGEVKLTTGDANGITLPKEIVIPEGAPSVKIKAVVAEDAPAGAQNIALNGNATVDKYAEASNGYLKVTVVEPPAEDDAEKGKE